MANTRYDRFYVYIKPVIGNKYIKSLTPYIFSIIAIIVFIVFAVRPTVLTIIDLQKNTQDSQEVLKILEQKILDLSSGKRNMDRLPPLVIAKINNSLPDNAEVTRLINDLQIAAFKNSSISAIQIQPVTIYANSTGGNPKQDLTEIEFSFNIQASYPDLLSILDNLSKSPRLINLNSVVLNKPAEGPTGMSVSGKTYYLKDKE